MYEKDGSSDYIVAVSRKIHFKSSLDEENGIATTNRHRVSISDNGQAVEPPNLDEVREAIKKLK